MIKKGIKGYVQRYELYVEGLSSFVWGRGKKGGFFSSGFLSSFLVSINQFRQFSFKIKRKA